MLGLFQYNLLSCIAAIQTLCTTIVELEEENLYFTLNSYFLVSDYDLQSPLYLALTLKRSISSKITSHIQTN